METADFDFQLPQELIAQHPPERRDAARMMVLHRADDSLSHQAFSDFPDLLAPGDLVIVNDTRVLPARLFGHRATGAAGATGAAIEALLIQEHEPNVWTALVRKAGRIREGEILDFEQGHLQARAEKSLGTGKWQLRFLCDNLRESLQKVGRAPLPPYIRRQAEDPHREADLQRYQTVMANSEGAVAAPTAGLHFTDDTFTTMRNREIDTATITLHVGEGTFLPVKVDSLQDHIMHAEHYHLQEDTAQKINAAKTKGHRVMAVGTTSLRCLESAAAKGLPLTAQESSTTLFIHPPHTFQVVDALLTNFHLPRSTLFMLVSAFAGVDIARRAYEEAIRECYRFYSYGDCMLIL